VHQFACSICHKFEKFVISELVPVCFQTFFMLELIRLMGAIGAIKVATIISIRISWGHGGNVMVDASSMVRAT